MIDEGLREDWHALRFDLLSSLAVLEEPIGHGRLWHALRVAATDAFDAPVPPHAVYRGLRTFAVVRWPDLVAVLAREPPAPGLERVLAEAIATLEAAVADRERGEADALEIELALLAALLREAR